MAVPDYESFMRPLLALLADGATRHVRDITDSLADEFGLSEEDRTELLPSGQRVLTSRVGWANTYLHQAGLIERPKRAHARITQAGLAALEAHPTVVDRRVLEQYPEFQAFLTRSREARPTSARTRAHDQGRPHQADPADAGLAEVGASPQDLIDTAVAENRAAVEGEVLRRALALDPKGFELLVIRLLERMGYGRAGAIEHSGRPGDRGIDGIISQDPLGLDRIYLQAKRYDPGNGVSRPDIQQFVGALMGAQGDRGVFITTSTFTSGATAEADRVAARIELIDGARLAQLMVRHGVGVQEDSHVVLYGVDEDFFDAL